MTIIENDAPTLTIESEQVAEGDGDMVFDVRLSQATSNEATVEYATSNGTAIQGTDYTAQGGTLTFPENSTIPQEIRVPILDDDVDDAIEEKTFNVTLSNALNAILAGGGTTLAVTGTIEDDDDPQVEVSFRKATYAVNEGETVEVTVRLSADPEREVTIPLTATPQNGATTADYSGVPQSVTFAAGKTSQAFNFTAINDTEDDDDERVELRFGSLPARVGVGSPAPATVAITDTNVPEVEVSFDQTRYTATEGGDAATVRVRLSADPERTVMIPLTHTPGNGAGVGDYSGVPASVTFGPSEQEHTLTVEATDDAEDDDGETVALGFGTLPPRVTKGPSATVALTDNDETSPPPPLRPPSPPPPPAAPPSAPDPPTVTEASTNSVTVSWLAPANDGPAISSYDLRYRPGSTGNFTDGPQDVTDTSATIGGLRSDTAYEVQVRASSAAGDGEWSAAGTVRTNAPPPPPVASEVTETSATSVTVSWSAPTDDGPPITGYDLRYREGSDGEFTDGPQDVKDTSATIEGLSPDTAYEVQVRASGTTGDGDWSALGVLRTDVLILYDLFSLSLDLDDSEGDQYVSFLTVSPGRVVPIQIFGADIQNTRDLSVQVGYDSTQVVFEAFDVGDMLPNAESLVARDSTFVEVGLASSGGQATADSSLVGTLRFRATDAFSETEIRLAGADVVRGEFPEVMTRSVSVALQAAAPPDPDFDGNGVVEFADFVLFAGAFGYGEGDDLPARSAQAGKYDVIYDLNGDGGIGFSDFVIFAGSFGNTVNRAPVFALAPPVARSVAENAPADQPIGDPVSASDADGHALTYSLWGADGDHFDIDASTGQIRTKGMYDFEQKRGYSVILRVIDGEGGRVSLVVSIAVTDVDE